jgi:hypothetical protein
VRRQATEHRSEHVEDDSRSQIEKERLFCDHMAWSSHQRRMLPVEWSTAGVAPGVYSLTVTVRSEDAKRTYATVADGAEFTIPAGPS